MYSGLKAGTRLIAGSGDWHWNTEPDDLERLVDSRRRRAARRALRASVLQHETDRVRVALRIHLLPELVESDLRREIAVFDDRLAVLRHCDPRVDPRCTDLHVQARTMHDRLGRQLDASTLDVDVCIGPTPTTGSDWTAGCLPRGVIREAGKLFAAARSDLVAMVDALVDGELLQPVAMPRRGSLPEFTVAEPDLDAVERVHAFVAALRHIADHSALVAAQMRAHALHREVEGQREFFDDHDGRRRRVLASLDGVRAVEAAIVEVSRAVGSSLRDLPS